MSGDRRQAVRLAPGPQALERAEVERVQRERLIGAMVAAYDEAMRRVLRVATDAYLDCEEPERRTEHALETFLELLAAEPELARVCVVEVLAAGPRARERRAHAMEHLAKLMQHALGDLRGDDRLDQLSAQALIGAVHELIYQPIDRHETASLPGMASEIVATQVAPLVAVGR